MCSWRAGGRAVQVVAVDDLGGLERKERLSILGVQYLYRADVSRGPQSVGQLQLVERVIAVVTAEPGAIACWGTIETTIGDSGFSSAGDPWQLADRTPSVTRITAKIVSAKMRKLRPITSGPTYFTPSFFCRLVDDVVYWNTSFLSG